MSSRLPSGRTQRSERRRRCHELADHHRTADPERIQSGPHTAVSAPPWHRLTRTDRQGTAPHTGGTEQDQQPSARQRRNRGDRCPRRQRQPQVNRTGGQCPGVPGARRQIRAQSHRDRSVRPRRQAIVHTRTTHRGEHDDSAGHRKPACRNQTPARRAPAHPGHRHGRAGPLPARSPNSNMPSTCR